MSPSFFVVGITTAREIVLLSDGYVNQWSNVTGGNGVRASFLLRLAKANALKVIG